MARKVNPSEMLRNIPRPLKMRFLIFGWFRKKLGVTIFIVPFFRCKNFQGRGEADDLEEKGKRKSIL